MNMITDTIKNKFRKQCSDKLVNEYENKFLNVKTISQSDLQFAMKYLESVGGLSEYQKKWLKIPEHGFFKLHKRLEYTFNHHLGRPKNLFLTKE